MADFGDGICPSIPTPSQVVGTETADAGTTGESKHAATTGESITGESHQGETKLAANGETTLAAITGDASPAPVMTGTITTMLTTLSCNTVKLNVLDVNSSAMCCTEISEGIPRPPP